MMPTPGPQEAGTPVWWLTQCGLYGWVRTAAKLVIIPYICYGACRHCSTTIYAWRAGVSIELLEVNFMLILGKSFRAIWTT